jgi:tRNA G18 (ribose-2'-O)-methylase SpoU
VARPIDDPADPRLADFAGDDPRLRRRELEQAARDAGYLIVEGAYAVRRLIGSGRRVRAVLVDATQHAALRDVLDDLDAPVYLGTRELIEATVGYAFHRGAIASADRDDGVDAAALLATATRIAVLEGVGDIENLGSIFRNAAGLGVDAVVFGAGCADPLYRRAVRVSMGHALLVPFARAAHWPGDLNMLRDNGFHLLAMTPDAGAQPLAQAVPALREAKLAILVGAEGPGLTETVMRASDLRVRIPMARSTDSLNVATAAALTFYERARA